MHPVIEKLIATGPIVTDGAWGTQLQALGLGLGDFPDEWNLSHAEQVEAVARAYVKAGSRIILTNTFGGNRFRRRVERIPIPQIDHGREDSVSREI